MIKNDKIQYDMLQNNPELKSAMLKMSETFSTFDKEIHSKITSSFLKLNNDNISQFAKIISDAIKSLPNFNKPILNLEHIQKEYTEILKEYQKTLSEIFKNIPTNRANELKKLFESISIPGHQNFNTFHYKYHTNHNENNFKNQHSNNDKQSYKQKDIEHEQPPLNKENLLTILNTCFGIINILQTITGMDDMILDLLKIIQLILEIIYK